MFDGTVGILEATRPVDTELSPLRRLVSHLAAQVSRYHEDSLKKSIAKPRCLRREKHRVRSLIEFLKSVTAVILSGAKDLA